MINPDRALTHKPRRPMSTVISSRSDLLFLRSLGCAGGEVDMGTRMSAPTAMRRKASILPCKRTFSGSSAYPKGTNSRRDQIHARAHLFTSDLDLVGSLPAKHDRARHVVVDNHAFRS